MKRISLCLAAGSMLLMLLTGCQNSTKENTTDNHIKVETQAVQKGTLEISTDYVATLSPNLTVDVMPLVAGTVETVTVKVGDRVHTEEVLAQLDDTSADLSVKSAEDAVESAKAGKDAAKSQADSARIQAEGNVKTLKQTLKGYRSSLKTAEGQLKKLQKSRKSIVSNQGKAKDMYVSAKTRYKTAQRLLIQFEAFLEENPDCKTMTGLMAAAAAVSPNPEDYTAMMPPEMSTEDPVKAAAKQKQAAILLKALNKAGLTVEYLGANGLEALKEDMNDGETAYNSVGASLGQIDSSIATMKTNIGQLKGQISATEENLKMAEKLQKAASAGSEAYDAQIEAARTGVEAAEYQKDLYRLTSPIDGIVDAVNVKENSMAAQGYAAFTISEKDSMIAAFYVSEDVKNFLKIGDTVMLLKEDENGKEDEIIGQITMIGTAVDPQKGLFKVEAEIYTTGQKELSGGTSVKLSVVSNAVTDQILIPYDSVYYEEGQAYVYRVIDGSAIRTNVETGLFNEEYITITSGLSPGESIITTWASGLKDGAEVEIIGGGEETQ